MQITNENSCWIYVPDEGDEYTFMYDLYVGDYYVCSAQHSTMFNDIEIRIRTGENGEHVILKRFSDDEWKKAMYFARDYAKGGFGRFSSVESIVIQKHWDEMSRRWKTEDRRKRRLFYLYGACAVLLGYFIWISQPMLMEYMNTCLLINNL